MMHGQKNIKLQDILFIEHSL